MNNIDSISKILAHIFDENNHVPVHLRRRIINELLWSATEDTSEGKKKKYKILIWSPNAIDKFQKNGSTQGLIHEHIYPKILIKKQIEVLKSKSPSAIATILNTYCHAAIITKDEDLMLKIKGFNKTTPTTYNDADPHTLVLSRYIETKIELVKVNFNENNINFTDYILKNNNDNMEIISDIF